MYAAGEHARQFERAANPGADLLESDLVCPRTGGWSCATTWTSSRITDVLVRSFRSRATVRNFNGIDYTGLLGG